MKFKELRHVLDVQYIVLDTPDGYYKEFNTRSEKYDDLEVCTIQNIYGGSGIFVAVK